MMTSLVFVAIIALVLSVAALSTLFVYERRQSSVILSHALADTTLKRDQLTAVLLDIMRESNEERRTAIVRAEEAAKSSEGAIKQFIEIMTSHADILRIFATQQGEFNLILRDMRPLLLQLGWLLAQTHLSEKGFSDADLTKLLFALTKGEIPNES